jgi:hypothetical protein
VYVVSINNDLSESAELPKSTLRVTLYVLSGSRLRKHLDLVYADDFFDLSLTVSFLR